MIVNDDNNKLEPEKNDITRDFFDITETVAYALIFVVLVFTFFFRIVGVEGDSMQQTLTPNDYVLITDFFYTPQRGNIVVITEPDSDENKTFELYNDENITAEPDNNKNVPLIKRIIAVGGDVVDLKNGELYVNGKLIQESYISDAVTALRFDEPDIYPLTIKEGEVFVLGDNRPRSKDSRTLGPITQDHILGLAFFRVYPFNKIGVIGNEEFKEIER